MTAEEMAALAEIADFCDDDGPRLIYADWVAEHGDSRRAEAIRTAIALGRTDNLVHPDRHKDLEAALKKLCGDPRWFWPPPPRPLADHIGVHPERGFPAAINFRDGADLPAFFRALADDGSDFTRAPLPATWWFDRVPEAKRDRDRLLKALRSPRVQAVLWHVGIRTWTPAAHDLLKALPGVRGVSVQWVDGQWTDDDMRALAGLPQLRSIDLGSCREVTDDGVRALGVLRKLRKLHMAWVGRLTGEGFDALAGTTTLEDIVLAGPEKFTSAAFRHFSQLVNLRRLAFSWNSPIDDRALAHLKHLTRLRFLSLSGSSITGVGLKHLAGCRELRWLDVGQTPIDDRGLAALPELPELERLEMRHAPFVKHVRLRNLPRLDTLWLPDRSVERVDFAGLPSLTDLYIHGDALTDAGLAGLAGAPNLRKLRLWGEQLGDGLFSRLAPLNRLETLELSACLSLRGDGLAALADLPALRTFSIAACQGLDSTSGPGLLRLPGLRELRLHDCPRLTDAWLASLAGLTGLRELSLRGCSALTDAAVEPLSRLTWLKKLNLMRCPRISRPAKAEIARRLRGCKVSGK